MSKRTALMNPGKYHLGNLFIFPPVQNRKYVDVNLIKKIQWKTSALINRRAYVGNVKIVDKDNTSHIFTDSIFKSKSNKFDVFTMDRRIDVAVGDGEEIVRLIGYADRLLQFKQNTLHIINVSGQAEYLEATHKYKGVSNPNQVCETDFGIAWCNNNGVYFYNGETVTDLFIKSGVKVISQEKWDAFYNDSNETMIGYSPAEKQLVLFQDVTNGDDVMVYDMITTSWVEGGGRTENKEKTNFVNIWDGRLAFGYESNTGATTISPWNPSPTRAITPFAIETKNHNFGTQANKKVTKVYITLKGSNPTNIVPKFSVDGGAFSGVFKDTSGNNITNIAGPGNTWTEIEMLTDGNANNVKSFAVRLEEVSSQSVVSDIQINDITIVYRTKSVK
tara:strand:+ start:2055 stop:3224 length:1170 start_codon:yes stop_codon:yes gene_type:complete